MDQTVGEGIGLWPDWFIFFNSIYEGLFLCGADKRLVVWEKPYPEPIQSQEHYQELL